MNEDLKQPVAAVGMDQNHADTTPTINLAYQTIAGKVADLMHPDNAPDQTQPLWETDPDFINPFAELPPIQCWCEIGERPALPKEGIVSFQAKPKKGKSYSTYAFAIPLLSGLDFGSIHPTDRPNLIMVFDMELSKNTNTKRAKNQVQTIGKYGNRFVVCSLKGKTIEQRIKTIQEKIEKYNPGIVVIDQVAKLVNDINNTTEANQITDILDKMSINRSVWVVIHENKGDENARGHVGTYLSHAAVEAYTVDKKHGVFTVSLKELRDGEEEDAPTFQFAIDTEGRIIDGTDQAKQAEEQKKAEWLQNAQRLFGGDDLLSYTELCKRIVSELERKADTPEQKKKAEDNAKNKIRNMVNAGVIRKTGTDRNAPYSIVANTNVGGVGV